MKHVTVRTQKYLYSWVFWVLADSHCFFNCFFSQVHIALDDQTGERGGLHFVPGSHRSQHCTYSYSSVGTLLHKN